MKKPLLSELTLREKIGQTALGRARNKDLLDLKKTSLRIYLVAW